MTAEDLCRRCARCCFEKLVIGDEVIITDTPCRFLDLQTRLCRVYSHRHHANVRCLTVAEGIAVRAFPADCPYVRNRDDYQAPLDPKCDGRAARLLAAHLADDDRLAE